MTLDDPSVIHPGSGGSTSSVPSTVYLGHSLGTGMSLILKIVHLGMSLGTDMC